MAHNELSGTTSAPVVGGLPLLEVRMVLLLLSRTCSQQGGAILCLRNAGTGAQGARMSHHTAGSRGAEIPTTSDDFRG